MEEYDTSIKDVARSTGIILIGLFFSKLITYIFRVISARYGAEDYGLLSLCITTVTLIAIFCSIGLDKGIIRYLSYYLTTKETPKIKGTITFTLLISLGLSIIITLFCLIFVKNIQNFFFPNITSERFTIMLSITFLTIPFNVTSKIMVSIFKSFKKPEYEVYTRSIIENLVKTILALILFILGFTIISISLAYAISMAISVIIGYYLVIKIFPELFKKIKAEYNNKEILNYSLPLTFVSMFYLLVTSLDTIMLGSLQNEYSAGIYNAVAPTAQLLFVLPYAILTLFIPIFTSLYVKKMQNEMNQFYKTVTKWILISNLLILILLIIYPKEILQTLFGQEYAIGSSALIILGIGYFILFLLYASENILMVIKKTKIIFYNCIIVIIINIILNYLLIPKYNILGASISTGISFALWGILILCESYYYTKMIPFKRASLNIFAIGILIIIIFIKLKKFIQIENTIYLIIFITTVIIIYSISLIIIKTIEKEDKIIINYIEEKSGINLSFFKKIIRSIIRQ